MRGERVEYKVVADYKHVIIIVLKPYKSKKGPLSAWLTNRETLNFQLSSVITNTNTGAMTHTQKSRRALQSCKDRGGQQKV